MDNSVEGWFLRLSRYPLFRVEPAQTPEVLKQEQDRVSLDEQVVHKELLGPLAPDVTFYQQRVGRCPKVLQGARLAAAAHVEEPLVHVTECFQSLRISGPVGHPLGRAPRLARARIRHD